MKRLLTFFMIVFLLAAAVRQPVTPVAAKNGSGADWTEVAQGIIRWKKLENGSSANGYLLNDTHLSLAGSSAGDWYAFAVSRLGTADNQSGYLAMLREYVQSSYRKSGGLSATKVTEWHRIALTVLACGGNPESFGTDASGKPINLIADGTYYRGKTAPLGAQGLNGWIWALLTLDSRNYAVPADASNTREDMITAILSCQLSEGGFSLAGSNADADITAMALQALAPYYKSGAAYTFTLKSTKQQVTRTVREAVDDALFWLSGQQLANGTFASYGTANANTTSQVIVALCSLGIAPEQDSRFQKNGNSLTDAFLSFRQPDGGFSYNSAGSGSNSMAGEQALCAVAALLRLEQGKGSLYDLTDRELFQPSPTAAPGQEPTLTTKPTAAAGKEPTGSAAPKPTAVPSVTVTPVGSAGPEISGGVQPSEGLMQTPKPSESPELLPSPTVTGVSQPDFAAELPECLTTADYAAVVSCLEQWKHTEESAVGRAEAIERLERAKTEIEAVFAEIEALNRELPETLYPLEALTWKDRKTVEGLWERYRALAPEDRRQVRCSEDLQKARAQVRASLRGLWLRAGVGVAAVTVAAALAVRAKRRKKRWTEGSE